MISYGLGTLFPKILPDLAWFQILTKSDPGDNPQKAEMANCHSDAATKLPCPQQDTNGKDTQLARLGVRRELENDATVTWAS